MSPQLTPRKAKHQENPTPCNLGLALKKHSLSHCLKGQVTPRPSPGLGTQVNIILVSRPPWELCLGQMGPGHTCKSPNMKHLGSQEGRKEWEGFKGHSYVNPPSLGTRGLGAEYGGLLFCQFPQHSVALEGQPPWPPAQPRSAAGSQATPEKGICTEAKPTGWGLPGSSVSSFPQLVQFTA